MTFLVNSGDYSSVDVVLLLELVGLQKMNEIITNFLGGMK